MDTVDYGQWFKYIGTAIPFYKRYHSAVGNFILLTEIEFFGHKDAK